MSQYQQWLHCRAVDQQLHIQQEQLEKELADLHEQADLLKASASATDNVIIQALARLYKETSQAHSLSAQPTGNVRSGAIVAGGGPVDQQSVRTNYVVQRWMERWGRHATPVQELHEDVQRIFAQLQPQEVEQFYRSYQYWQLQQRIAQIQAQIIAVQQQVSKNIEQMEQAAPGAVALATLARLQASGVNDIDLLDKMLARGEAWLDYAMQLLEQCEALNIIDGDYTRWCELALEGAYDWIASMLEANSLSTPQAASSPTSSPDETTEEMLLQKLMSDDGLEESSVTADATPMLTAIPVEETTEPEKVEVSSIEEPTLPDESIPEEEIAVASVEEPVPLEEIEEQEVSGDNSAGQVSPPIHEALLHEQEVSIPETPRPAILETESEESETEEEVVTVPPATASDADETIHAIEEIMYFTDETPWQWEESVSSETHVPALPESEEEQKTQDEQSVKQGFFHRLFKKKGTEND